MLVLSGGVHASPRQCEVLLSAALDACERNYSAFQFVARNGAGAREALDAAMSKRLARLEIVVRGKR